MDTLVKLCKISLSYGKVQYSLESFHDDPMLNSIMPKFQSIVNEGKEVHAPGLTSTISIYAIENEDMIRVSCTRGYNPNVNKLSTISFIWDLKELQQFFDYVEDHGIKPSQ